jgi:hypothetical protein
MKTRCHLFAALTYIADSYCAIFKVWNIYAQYENRFGGSPFFSGENHGKSIYKWMRSGGTTILGNPHILLILILILTVAKRCNVSAWQRLRLAGLRIEPS